MTKVKPTKAFPFLARKANETMTVRVLAPLAALPRGTRDLNARDKAPQNF
jgi:hypothetical protein